MLITLHDLVTAKHSGPFFSPFCFPARLALMAKGLDFQTEEVTYHDLRFVWTPKLEVKRATAPFVQKPDGSYLMDSVQIALWLDQTYPERQNLFLPEAELPVDPASAEYRKAIQGFKDMYNSVRELNETIALLYAPRITKALDPEANLLSSRYWIEKHNYPEGEWERLTSATEEDDGRLLRQVGEKYLSADRSFLASPSKPGFQDFSLAGMSRLLRSLSARLFSETFLSKESGEIAGWMTRMDQTLPTPEVWGRDPQV
ncbi:hypothetical protein JCM8202v2_001550 [Rhodotorula sphaerocarpa]